MTLSLSKDQLDWTSRFTGMMVSPTGTANDTDTARVPELSAIKTDAPGGGAESKNTGGKPKQTDEQVADNKGRDVGKRLATGKLKPEDKKAMLDALQNYHGDSYEAFTQALDSETRGTGFAVDEVESKDAVEDGHGNVTTESTLIIPVADPKADRGGFKVQYSAQIYEETSDSTSVEVYNDVSGSVGVGLDIPIKKVVKIKLSADAKHGRKSADKSETKHATRKGETISRSFTVKHLVRDIVSSHSTKVYHDPEKFSDVTGTTWFAKKVTHEQVSAGPDVQHGYTVVPDEGGQPWGPFWSKPQGQGSDEKVGLKAVWDVLESEQKKIAEDLAFGPPEG